MDQHVAIDIPEQEQRRNHERPGFWDLCAYFRYNGIRGSPEISRNTLLLIIGTVAALTYKAPVIPIMGTHSPTLYGMMVLCNSTLFFFALHLVHILTLGIGFQSELRLLLFGLAINYCMNIYGVLSNDEDKISDLFMILCLVIPAIVVVLSVVGRDLRRRLGWCVGI